MTHFETRPLSPTVPRASWKGSPKDLSDFSVDWRILRKSHTSNMVPRNNIQLHLKKIYFILSG